MNIHAHVRPQTQFPVQNIPFPQRLSAVTALLAMVHHPDPGSFSRAMYESAGQLACEEISALVASRPPEIVLAEKVRDDVNISTRLGIKSFGLVPSLPEPEPAPEPEPEPVKAGIHDGGNSVKVVFATQDWVKLFTYSEDGIAALSLLHDLGPRMLTSARAKILGGKYPETKKRAAILADIQDGYLPEEVAARNRIPLSSAQHYETLVIATGVLRAKLALGENVKVPNLT